MSEARDGFEWTNTTLDRLRTLWAEGHSTAEIGRRMGISKNAVVGKAHRLGLPARASPIHLGDPLAPKRAATRLPVPKLADIMPIRSTLPGAAVVMHATSAPLAVAAAAPTIGTDEAQARAVEERTHPCCWPIGDPRTPAFRFCEADAPLGKPYCTEHASVAYAKVRHRPSDADPILRGDRLQLGSAPTRSFKGEHDGMVVP